ncbi:MAG TPA: VOC family protein [Mycobacteriales bacterium]|nr:VOC family protein [Mycobacteriales bacterium]
MSTSISGVHVTVDDPDAALAFYRDSLGMTVANRVDKDGFSWITLTSDAQPEISIVLSQPHGGRSKEDGDALAMLLAKGALPMLQLKVSDLATTFDKLVATPGVEVLQEPDDRFWGVRDAAVRDPAGNMIRVAQA